MRYEDAEWLDGPALVGWLRQRGLENVKSFGTQVEGAVKRWGHGGRANIYAADQVLTTLGIHLSEVPDDFWLIGDRSDRRLSEEQLGELIDRLKAGEQIKPLAREYRLAPTTVRYHRDKHLAQAA